MNIKYIFTLLTGVIECLFFAGLQFGWASLVFVLKDEGYFCDQMVVLPTTPIDNSTTSRSINNKTSILNPTPSPSGGTVENHSDVFALQATVTPNGSVFYNEDLPDCSTYQSKQLNNVFTLASMLLAFSTLPNGYIFDTFGTWAARSVSLVLFIIGCILTAISSHESAWLLYPSMSCIAVGGILMLVTNLQIGNLFGKYRSSVITLMSGALDSSSFVFLIFKTLHHHGISLSVMFQATAWCTVLLWFRTFILLPKKTIPFPLTKGYNYGLTDFKCGNAKNDTKELTAMNGVGGEEKEALHTSVNSNTVLKVPSTKYWVQTSLFWGNALHFSVLQLRNYFYLSMLYDFLSQLNSDQSVVSSYLTVFGTCQLFGFLCAPLNGFLIDGVSKYLHSKKMDADLIPLRAVTYSAVATTTLGTVFSIFVAIPILEVQYGSFVLQVIFRSFLYGGSSSFIAAAFPAQHFGKLYGLTMCVAGVLLFIQFPLTSLVLDVMDKNFTVINIIFIVVSALTIIHPLNVSRWCRNKAAAKKKSIVRNGTD